METREFACVKAIDEAIEYMKKLKKERKNKSSNIVVIHDDTW